MKRNAFIILAALMALASANKVLAADGAQIYSDTCAQCHGDDGRAKTTKGKRLKIRDFSDPKIQDSFTDADAIKAVKEGIKKDNVIQMKAYKDDYTDDEVKAVVAYMRTIKKQ